MGDDNSLEKELTGIKQGMDSINNYLTDINKRLVVLEERTGIETAEQLPEKEIEYEKIDDNELKEEKQPENGQEESRGLEANLGLKWFGRIGILSLVLGVVFLIKYAFDQNLIGHLGRIILGILFGLGLVVSGELFDTREKYKRYARTLTGGGFAILYFAIYAAYHFETYRQAIGMSQTLDFILLSAVAVLSIIFSLRYNSKIILTEAFFLGYLTLILNPINLFTLYYALALTIGLIIITSAKKWVDISIGGLLGTYLLFMLWYTRNLHDGSISLMLLFAYFTIFTVNSFFMRDKDAKTSVSGLNKVLVVSNSLLFYFLSYRVVTHNYESYIGIFTLFVAAMYLGLSYLASEKNKDLIHTFLGLCVLYLTITIPIQFDGTYVTILWAVEGLILLYVGLAINEKTLRNYSYGIGVITVGKTLFVDSALQAFSYSDILGSTRLFTYLVSIAILYAISLLLEKNKLSLSKDELSLSSIYFVCASLLTTVLLALELEHYWISIGWAVQAIILSSIGIKYMNSYIRKTGMAIFCLVIVKVFLFDVSSLSTGYRTISFIALGVILLAASFIYTKYKDRLEGIV